MMRRGTVAVSLSLLSYVGVASPAFAQTATEETTLLSEVVVTARRVQENLQDVPISMTVLDQHQLNDRNIVNGQDLAAFTPSLSVNGNYGAQNTNFALRGFVQDLNEPPSVGVYFADVVSPHGSAQGVPVADGAGVSNYFDLENVEVLKGPQGTLFGRNTTGGAVLLVPKKPTSDLEGYVEGSYGNYNMERVQAVLNLPASDTIKLRMGVDQQKRDGFALNDTGIGPSRFDDVGYVTARLGVVIDLTPNLENYTLGYYSRSDNNGSVPHLFACNPASGFAFFCNAQLATQRPGFYNVESDNPYADALFEQWQIINTSTWKATDNLTLKNIASYGRMRDSLYNDIFGVAWHVPLPPAFGGPQPLSFSEINPAPGLPLDQKGLVTEEFQVQGDAMERRLTYQAGLYFEDSIPMGGATAKVPTLLTCANVFAFQCIDYIGLGAGVPIGQITYNTMKITARDYAAYAQSNFNLTDQLTLTTGIRYTEDRSSSDSTYVLYYFPTPNAPVGYCQNVFARSPTLPITAPSNCDLHFRQNSHAPTWLIDLDYKPFDNILTYAKLARGYRQGGISPNSPEGYDTFKQERVDTYEVGLKSSFKGAVPTVLNISAFYNDFTNQQLQIGFSSSSGLVNPAVGIVNAGKSRIYGTEIELSVEPFPGFRFDASYAYLNTELLSITFPSPVAGSRYDIFSPTGAVGSALPETPRNKTSLSATYELPIPDQIGKISANAGFTYRSSELITSASPYGTLPGLGLVNLNLAWRSIFSTPIDVSFFVTNLTNKQYYSWISGLYDAAGFESAQLGEPRMFGGRIRYNFGHGSN